MGLIKTKIDLNKAKSILKMSKITYDMLSTIDVEKYASNLVKEYYEILRELS